MVVLAGKSRHRHEAATWQLRRLGDVSWDHGDASLAS